MKWLNVTGGGLREARRPNETLATAKATESYRAEYDSDVAKEEEEVHCTKASIRDM